MNNVPNRQLEYHVFIGNAYLSNFRNHRNLGNLRNDEENPIRVYLFWGATMVLFDAPQNMEIDQENLSQLVLELGRKGKVLEFRPFAVSLASSHTRVDLKSLSQLFTIRVSGLLRFCAIDLHR